MDGDLHFALSRFVMEHHRELVVVLDKEGRVVDKSQSAENAELDIAALFDGPQRDLRIDAFIEELGLSGQAHTLVASPEGAVFRLEGKAVDKYRIVVAHQLSKGEEAKTSLGVVAASFVHDLNNLLMPILLLSGRLVRDLKRANEEEGSESAMIAQEINASASLAASLARDVLALSRPRVESIERVDVNEMVAELERLIRRLAGPQVDVLFALGSELELETRVNRKRLEHAVLTLVVNARDAMPDGGHLAISTALVDHGGARRIALSLTDTSEGEAEVPKSAADGFTVDVSAARGRGTSVTLLLEPAPPCSQPRPLVELDVHQNVIMVAERDELVRRAIQRVLESHGWTVVSVGSQDDALEAAAVHPLCIAMLDSAIFRRAPTTFLHQLRALAPRMRLVLLTDQALGDSVPNQVVVLPKPFGDEELVRAVRQALG